MCKSCQQLADVVLPTLQMFERRLAALEGELPAAPVRPPARMRGLAPSVQAHEREACIRALQQAQGIIARAAPLMGLSIRAMHYRVQQYGLEQYCALSRPRQKQELA